jgi:hypothetical protein
MPDATQKRLEPVLHVRFEVVAYDESGYGDNRSRNFADGQEAADYARGLPDSFAAQLWKVVTMEPIRIPLACK